jgi:hypothetical protein
LESKRLLIERMLLMAGGANRDVPLGRKEAVLARRSVSALEKRALTAEKPIWAQCGRSPSSPRSLPANRVIPVSDDELALSADSVEEPYRWSALRISVGDLCRGR